MLRALLLVLFLVAAASAMWFLTQGGGVSPVVDATFAQSANRATEDGTPESPSIEPTTAGQQDAPAVARSEVVAPEAELPPGAKPVETRDVVVKGRVVQENGAAVAGAVVSASGTFRGFQTGEHGDTTKTGADGRFELKTRNNMGLKISAQTDSFVTATARVPASAEGVHDVGDMIVTLGGSLAGTIRDDAGQPVAGAEVSVFRKSDGSGDGSLLVFAGFGGGAEQKAKTDASGRYRMDAVEPGEVAVLASRDGFTRESRKGVVIKKGELTQGVDVAISRGSEIAGVVVDDDGKPVRGARVSVQETVIDLSEPGMNAVFGDDRAATTDDGGFFRLTGLKESQYHVAARKDGFIDGGSNDVKAGATDVRITLGQSGVLFGYVTDVNTDEPLEDFKVSVRSRGSRGFSWQGEAVKPVTGEEAAALAGVVATEGLFAVSGLSATKVDVEVSRDGYLPFSQGPIDVSRGTKARVDAEMTPAIHVAGVVTDPAGNPVAGARVVANADQGSQPTGTRALRVRHAVAMDDVESGPISFDHGGHTDTTDEAGRFQIDELSAGDFVFTANHPDWARSDDLRLTLTEGHPVDDAALTLNVGGALTGVAYDADGNAVADARITVRPKKAASSRSFPTPDMLGAEMDGQSDGGEAVSDADGRYEIRGLAPGVYLAEVKRPAKPGGGSFAFQFAMLGFDAEPTGAPVTIEAGETAELDLYLPPTGRIEGRVTEQGSPLAGVGVKLSKKDDPMPMFMGGPSARTDEYGRFEIDEIEPGEYTATLSGIEAAVPIQRDVEVHPRRTEQADFRIPTGSITGYVKDTDSGAPLAGVTVIASPARSGEEAAPTPRRVGVFAIATSVSGEGGGTTTMKFGDDEEVVETDENGYFELKRLEAGLYDVAISNAGVSRQKEEDVRVNDGAETSGVTFHAARGASITVRVVAPGNRPLQFFSTSYYNVETPNEVERRAEAGSDSMTIDGLAPGVYHFDVRSESSSGEEEVKVSSGEEKTVTIYLR